MSLQKMRALFFLFALLAASAASFGQIAVSVTFAPPALPVYEQPICPGEGYLWTPGFWDYADDDYFWVPGTWVLAPEPGLFWTPGYWTWAGEGFTFYPGYWGPQVGFYGGINYGFGYFGEGYQGGRWDHDRFFYNRAVNNVNVTEIHNVYNTTVVINNTNVNRVSYNGGNGGISARPRPEEQAVARERHIPPVTAQAEHIQLARSNPEQRASMNHGRPPVAATLRPGAFRGNDAVAAKEAGAPYNPDRNRGAKPRADVPDRLENAQPDNTQPDNNRSQANPVVPAPVVHANDLPHGQPARAPDTGNQKSDREYEQQQKLQAKQDKEQQKLQQKQDRDHEKMSQSNADDARKQHMEQRHQQQTQQLQQRHDQQQQRMQQRMPPPQREQPPQKDGSGKS